MELSLDHSGYERLGCHTPTGERKALLLLHIVKAYAHKIQFPEVQIDSPLAHRPLNLVKASALKVPHPAQRQRADPPKGNCYRITCDDEFI